MISEDVAMADDRLYRAFCTEPGCLWSSPAVEGHDNVTDYVVNHFSGVHGVTNFTQELNVEIEDLPDY